MAPVNKKAFLLEHIISSLNTIIILQNLQLELLPSLNKKSLLEGRL